MGGKRCMCPRVGYSSVVVLMLLCALLAQTQEMWSFLVPSAWLLLFATDEQWERAKEPANALLLIMFLLHYFNR